MSQVWLGDKRSELKRYLCAVYVERPRKQKVKAQRIQMCKNNFIFAVNLNGSILSCANVGMFIHHGAGSGGETHFGSLGVSVQPQKGSAILWPNVNDIGETIGGLNGQPNWSGLIQYHGVPVCELALSMTFKDLSCLQQFQSYDCKSCKSN